MAIATQTDTGRTVVASIAAVRAGAPMVNHLAKGGTVGGAIALGIRQLHRDGTLEHMLAHTLGVKLPKGEK